MDFKTFMERLEEDIKQRLQDDDINVESRQTVVNKLNSSYDSLSFNVAGEDVAMNINVNHLYEAYGDGVSYEEILDGAVERLHESLDHRLQIDAKKITDYEMMKDTLITEVVSIEDNKEFLKTIPYKEMEDMAIVYRFIVDINNESRSTLLVTNDLMEVMGVTKDQLHEDALKNAPKIKPAVIQGMSEVLMEMGIPADDLLKMEGEHAGQEMMYVATVDDKINGAGVIAYEGFMDQAAERVGGDFYLLPSSRHEVLLVPDNGEVAIDFMKDTVSSINAEYVDEEDKLTDSVYHYDSKNKIFELGEKFVARQNEKEALKKSLDLNEEKGSILLELNNKKEKCAAKPHKKDTVEKTAKSKGGEAI